MFEPSSRPVSSVTTAEARELVGVATTATWVVPIGCSIDPPAVTVSPFTVIEDKDFTEDLATSTVKV